MGDMLTLIEKTQSVYSENQAKALEEKIRKSGFTLDDFLEQMRQMKKIGSMGEIMKMIPGLSRALPKDFDIPEKDFQRVEAIISSMTRAERRNPSLLNGSRRKRIAFGSGTQVSDVNKVIKNFEGAQKMMKQLGGGKGRRKTSIPRPW
jgi:signal recognition particle subunit SRP54